MIRQAKEEDYLAIVDMSREFWSHTQFDEPLDDESVLDWLYLCKDSLFVVDINGPVGFGCFVVAPLLGNKRALIAAELAWWVNPDHRGGRNAIGLLKAMESSARDMGVKYFSMMYMESSMPDSVRKLYEKMGYNVSETTYLKVL